MASFPALDRSLQRAVRDLHDVLWTGKPMDETGLVARLERGVRDLDRWAGAHGTIASGVRPLLHPFRPRPSGGDLFTYLDTISNVAAAVAYVRTKPRESARRASELAVSLSIGLATAADSFHLVEAFESGGTDFGGFAERLAEVLEQKGAIRAKEFRRATEEAFDLHALWDGRASRDAQCVTALACVGCAALSAELYAEGLKALGRYRKVPYDRLVPAVRRILDRLGKHP